MHLSVQESLVVISGVVVLHAADTREVVFSITANLSDLLTLKRRRLFVHDNVLHYLL